MDNRTLPRHNHVRRSDVNCCLCYQFVLDHVFKKAKEANPTVSWLPCAQTSHEFSAMGKMCEGPDLQPNLEHVYMAHPPAQENDDSQTATSNSKPVQPSRDTAIGTSEIVEGRSSTAKHSPDKAATRSSASGKRRTCKAIQCSRKLRSTYQNQAIQWQVRSYKPLWPTTMLISVSCFPA